MADREKDREIQKLQEDLAFVKRDRMTSPALLGRAQYDKIIDSLTREICYTNENLIALEAENEKVQTLKENERAQYVIEKKRELELLNDELASIAPNHDKLREEQKRQTNIYNKIKLKHLELQDEIFDSQNYEKD